jgi:uncharacterized protein (DUF488 family)
MKIFTAGFTQSTAQAFFERLQASGASKLIDVRLNNVSQLAGFAKRDDLKFFADRICGMPYEHVPALAPTREMLDEYKRNHGSWEAYREKFLSLMAARRIETFAKERIDGGCLLCSEATPHRCHRRLVAEYLSDRWGDLEIVHL